METDSPESPVSYSNENYDTTRYADNQLYKFYDPYYVNHLNMDTGEQEHDGLERNEPIKSKPDSKSEEIYSKRKPIPKRFDSIQNKHGRVNLARPSIDRPTTGSSVKAVKPDRENKIKQKPIPFDWTKYHRLDAIHRFMENLESDYPSLCTTGSIGQSLEGRDLKILRISNSNVTNASVWIDAGIHAREWITPATATFIANHIAKNFDSLPEYVTNKDWYFLPVMNPDGYEYSHTCNRMWRKNRAWHAGQCVGVDLNRNFSYGWGGKESSDIPTNAFYHGPEPFSEPESTAVSDMLMNSGISFSVYITLHSYGQVILFPFAFQDEPCPSYTRLLEGATVMSRAIYNTSGCTYKVGTSKDVMYGAAGTSNDWSYGVAGIPYCYLLELRSKKHKFRLPVNEISETGNEILSSVFALMHFVDNYTPPKFDKYNSNSEDSSDN